MLIVSLYSQNNNNTWANIAIYAFSVVFRLRQRHGTMGMDELNLSVSIYNTYKIDFNQ